MKRILMRAKMSPLAAVAPEKVILKNLMGCNIGNLLFQASVYKTLLCEDTQIDIVGMGGKNKKWDTRALNAKYDACVLPLANAFRPDFIDELRNMTNLVKGLKMPCVVVGVGAQAELGKTEKNDALDRAVKDFLKAVLKKSSLIGIRGEFTADYLKGLGFVPERDFTVIGCPSVFLYGKDLPRKEKKALTETSRVCVNSKIDLPQNYQDFMDNNVHRFSDYVYIPQVIQEISAMYLGMKMPKSFLKDATPKFPTDYLSPIYKNGYGVTFSDVFSWLDFLSTKDFAFGSRIHGNIAAILAGLPCYILVSDMRIKELAEYHHIPHKLITDCKKDDDIFSLYEQADFDAVYKDHDKRFMTYLNFLEKNGLKTIYDENGECDRAPFDEKHKGVTLAGPLTAFSAASKEEQLRRLQKVYQVAKIRQRVKAN